MRELFLSFLAVGILGLALSAPATLAEEQEEMAEPSPIPMASPSPSPKDRLKKTRKKRPVPISTADLPPLLHEVEKKYAKAETLSADFVQVNEVAALRQTKKSSGKIQFKRPDKIRWETLSPDKNLLVSDGKAYWFYTPPFDETEPGQVMERKSSQVQTKLAHALLSGKFSVAKDMKIQKETDSTFRLIPKRGSAGTVTLAKIEIDPKQKLIVKVILEHKGGNRSEISLSQIKLGEELEDELFKFIPPPNTERLKD